ncbi:MAG TPA: hypothetical protein VMV44_04885 [Rectinemataceae bacterium]|nr:hypothetical protein [Rectinemataceae bacterium]
MAALDSRAGIELGFLSVPVLTPDPYSFAASAGLWYDLGGIGGLPLSLGAWAGAAGFRPLTSSYGASTMYYGGLETGYDLALFQGGDILLTLRPFARAGWYLRGVDILGKVEWGSRPFLSSGLLLDFKSGVLDLGLSALLSLPLDNRPVVLVGFLQRIGLWLP